MLERAMLGWECLSWIEGRLESHAGVGMSLCGRGELESRAWLGKPLTARGEDYIKAVSNEVD